VHLFVLPFGSSYVVAIATMILALRWGGWRERAILSAQLLLLVLEDGFCWLQPCVPLWPWPKVVVDGLILAICLACVVRAERYWVIWATAFGLLALVSDLMSFVPRVTPWAWVSATIIWSYMISVAVLWGVWTTARARRGASLPA
jgi:hypothetical protein